MKPKKAVSRRKKRALLCAGEDGASVAYSGATSWNSDHSQALSSSLIW